MAGKNNKKNAYPEKRTMNLYYKPDRTTFPATVALYVLFVLSLLLAFGKFFVYDILVKYEDTKEQLAQVQEEKRLYEEQLTDYDEVLHRYQMYSSTDEEDRQTDRMEVLRMIDEIVRPYADLEAISIADGLVSLRFSGVTLSETAEIVQELNHSPIVSRTTVNTAATVEKTASAGAGRISGTDIFSSGAQEQAGSGAQSGDGQNSGGNEQPEDPDFSGSGQPAGGQNPSGGRQVAAERKGNQVTADILIALKKESGEEGVRNEATTDEP